MPRNQKLTSVIGGRTIQWAMAEAGTLVIHFNDESTMQVKATGITGIFPPGGTIKAILEDGAELKLQLEDDSTIRVELADPGASVAVRDKINRVEYLG